MSIRISQRPVAMSRPRMPPSGVPETAAAITKPRAISTNAMQAIRRMEFLLFARISSHISIEADLGDCSLCGVFNLEEIPLGEAEHAGDDVRGEHLNLVVEAEDLVVVALPCEGDLVLGAAKLFLEGEEVLVGLEVGIVLHDEHELAESLSERSFGFGCVGDIAGAHSRSTGLSNRLEGPAFVRHIAFCGLDEIGD